MSKRGEVQRSAVVLICALGAAVTTGCPPGDGEPCENRTCEPILADGGEDADASSSTDRCLAQPDAPDCLSDDTSLFVSSLGDDVAGAGTKANPYKTLGVALDKIQTGKKRIYLCEGEYPEDVVLDARHSGVSLYGGFACDWSVTSVKPKLGAGQTALTINGATGVAIATIAFEAKKAAAAGGSSVGASVTDKSDVTFKGVSFAAGAGMAGDKGTLTPFSFPDATMLQGKNGDAPENGGATPVICPGDTIVSSTGGAGGNDGFPGKPGLPGPENGGSTNVCAGPGTGGDGRAGIRPEAAASIASRGELSADGWRPRAGTSGAKGGPGQGGGGGYPSGGATARGGGGGAGGCGGAGGGGGQGGGGSIALASVESTVVLIACSLSASDGGSGGDGVEGQVGQAPGGPGGNKSTGSTSCAGGTGGPGAQGGEGGGGAGGISIGVLYTGTEPVLDEATTAATSVKSAGAGGIGGKPGMAPNGNNGPTGVAANKHDAKQL